MTARGLGGGPLVEARRVENRVEAAPHDFHYSEARPGPPRPAAMPGGKGDKRTASRQRTRLRSGKVVDAEDRFVSECLVFDRSDTGARLRLPGAVTVPGVLQFFDDQSATLFRAEVVWRRGLDIGLRFRPFATTARTRALAAAMRGRFYRLPG